MAKRSKRPAGSRNPSVRGPSKPLNPRPRQQHPPKLPTPSKKIREFEAKEEADSDATALTYLRSLFDTANSPPARFPDTAPLPTAVSRSSLRYNFTRLDDAKTNLSYFCFIVYPRLNGQVYVPVIDGGALTWFELSDDPNYAYFTTNAARAHCVGQEINVENLGVLVKEGGVMYVGNFTGQYGAKPATVSEITTNQSLKVIPLSSPDLQKLSRTNWLPGDELTQAIYYEPDTTTGAWNQGGIIVFAALGVTTGDVAQSANFIMQVFSNWEFQPNPVGATVTNPVTQPGDPGKVGAILEATQPPTTLSAANDKTSSFWDNIVGYFSSTGITEMINDAMSVAGTVMSIASFFGGLFTPRQSAEWYSAVAKHLTAKCAWREAHLKGKATLEDRDDSQSPYFVPRVRELLPPDHPCAQPVPKRPVLRAVDPLSQHGLRSLPSSPIIVNQSDSEYVRMPRPPKEAEERKLR